jgi:hypothetical protein
MSMGLAPKSSPPGIAIRACPVTASRGPSNAVEARIFSTNS